MWKWRKKASKLAGKPALHRRDLLQGRFWKLIRTDRLKPLVMRYPVSRDDVGIVQAESSNDSQTSQPTPTEITPSVNGIAIGPVSPTKFSAPKRSVTIPLFRPPGAVEESAFLAGCTRCSDCVNACPHDAIVKASEGSGAAVGTPVIKADVMACQMCEDFPCIQACDPGVLSSALPKTIGTAKVTEHLCLAHHSTTCTVCSERCPIDNAIHVTDGKPTVNEDACTGCGVCRYVCPAPENAILLMPIFNRPSLP